MKSIHQIATRARSVRGAFVSLALVSLLLGSRPVLLQAAEPSIQSHNAQAREPQSAVLEDATPRIDWPEKDGPTQSGLIPSESARRLPLTWNEETGENIAWKVPLSGQGHSTPVIGQGRIWLTAASEDGKQQFVYCLDVDTGKVLHHKLLFENSDPEPLGNAVNNYAAPSSVLTADALYVHFGTYGTARLDPQTAEVVWQRRDIHCRHFRGPGSSPTLWQDRLILTFDGIDTQFVTALGKQNGATLWQTPRTTDYGDLLPDGTINFEGDLRKAYNTPCVTEVAGRWQVISVGSKAAFGYDAFSGEQLWTVRHSGYNGAPRPILLPGQVILSTGTSGELICLRLDATTRGDVTETHCTWVRPRGNAKMPWPLVVDDRLYMVMENGVVYCLDTATGKELWAKRVGGSFVASPLAGAGRLYVCDEQGKITVLSTAATEQADVLAENQLSDGMRASPAAADGALYLRTYTHLYKIIAQ